MSVSLASRGPSVPAMCMVVMVAMVWQTALGAPDPGELANLGRALFFDVNLSARRTQSCASCHDPARAFSDSRDNGVSRAVSLGGDGSSLGDRNTPSTTYAFLIPDFQKDDKNELVGGFFHDGFRLVPATLTKEHVGVKLNDVWLGRRLADHLFE